MRRIGDLIERDATRIARIESENTGKTLANALGDIDFAVEAFHFSPAIRRAPTASTSRPPTPICSVTPGSSRSASSARSPPGTTRSLLAAMKIAPALAAGCAVVIKPAPETPLSTLELAAARGRGGPAGGLPERRHRRRRDRRRAGRASRHRQAQLHRVDGDRPCSRALAGRTAPPGALELGGKSPNIVFADVDLEASLDSILMGALANSGQECCAGARVLVEREIFEEFRDLAAERIQSLRVGAGTDAGSEIGR